MRILHEPLSVLRANLRTYLVLNAVVHGLLLAGMAIGVAFSGLNADRVGAQQADGTVDTVVGLFDNLWLFALTILAVNLVTVAAARILLPSLLVPFAGVALFGYQALTIGVTLAPVDEATALLLIPHSLAIVIEFQAYLLLVLGSWLHGRAWLWPATVGADTRRQAYAAGLRQAGWLVPPALVLFVVGAVYEAYELIHLVPPLVRG